MDYGDLHRSLRRLSGEGGLEINRLVGDNCIELHTRLYRRMEIVARRMEIVVMVMMYV